MSRFLAFLSLLPVVFAAAACQETDPDDERQRLSNTWMMDTLRGESIDSAILAQQTLYPYHFRPDGKELNDLGRSDLRVLADHYRRTPGVLNMPRRQTPEALYAARVEEVLALLDSAGVDVALMSVEDGMAGGDGSDAARVQTVLERDREGKPLTSTTSSSSGGSGGYSPASGMGVSR